MCVDGNVPSIVNEKLAAKPESYILKYLASCIAVFLKHFYGIQSIELHFVINTRMFLEKIQLPQNERAELKGYAKSD